MTSDGDTSGETSGVTTMNDDASGGRGLTDASGSESFGGPAENDQLGCCCCTTDGGPTCALWMLVGLLGLGARRQR